MLLVGLEAKCLLRGFMVYVVWCIWVLLVLLLTVVGFMCCFSSCWFGMCFGFD